MALDQYKLGGRVRAEKTTVRVTQEDINRGEDYETERPVARALRRLIRRRFQLDTRVIARTDYIGVSTGFSFFRIPTPPDVAKFILDFGSGRKVRPFDFDLEIPSETLVKDRVKESQWPGLKMLRR